MAKTKKKTTKPSNLSITRSGNTYTIKFKKGMAYEKCQVQYSFGHGWKPSIPYNVKTATSKSVTIPAGYPDNNTYHKKVMFRVRGCAKDTSKYNYTWSDWVEKTVPLIIPPVSSWATAWDSDHDNRTTFTWSTSVSSTSWAPYRNSIIQTALVKNCNTSIADANKNGVPGATWIDEKDTHGKVVPVTSSGSRTRTEESETLADGNSWTRWYRIRSRGCSGTSAWTYAKHVYATPKAGTISTVTLSDTAQGYLCYVKWTADSSQAWPIDATTVQYAIEVPDENLQCPAGASWTDAVAQADTGGADGARFSIDTKLAEDQALWVRIKTQHDNRITYGAAKMANETNPVKIGTLKAPTITDLETDSTTYRVSITVDHKTEYAGTDMVTKVYMRRPGYDDVVVGTIPNGETSAIIQCPAWESEVAFGAQESIADRMLSEITWRGGVVPTAPTDVVAYPNQDTVRLEWTWTWDAADSAELSWADHEDAWESTDQPDTYEINKMRASSWNITGLETGKTWYFRVRLVKGTGESKVYGPYSDIVALDLTSAPAVPALTVLDPVIPLDGETTVSWAYVTTDGTAQALGEILDVETNSIIARTEAQYATITGDDLGYGTHLLAVRVMSQSGKLSEWSTPQTLTVAEQPVAEIVSTSLVEETVIDSPTASHTAYVLHALPLTVEITGTQIIIERAEDYDQIQPDGVHRPGYKGQTMAIVGGSNVNISEIALDDGCSYRLIAVNRDDLGQVAETDMIFEVHWSHQAVTPTATVSLEDVALITPVQGEALATDSVDIYRLSKDRPQLIYENCTWGEIYVDPYPAIGGGYRIVGKTAEGDYMNDAPAWIDIETGFNAPYTIINFDTDIVELPYNLELDHSWKKTFEETQYLGGTVRGSWGAAVSRTGGISTVCVDDDVAEALRRLAVWPGICHVRTPDGSSYSADIQVSEKEGYSQAGKIATFDLNITRVDPEQLDGMTLEQWEGES